MENATYTGWTNYETWAVALWLGSDESSYRYWREQAYQQVKNAPYSRQVKQGLSTPLKAAQNNLANQLKNEVKDRSPQTEPCLYSDLLYAALCEVHWKEIAEHLLADLPDSQDTSHANEKRNLGHSEAVGATMFTHLCRKISTLWAGKPTEPQEELRIVAIDPPGAQGRCWVMGGLRGHSFQAKLYPAHSPYRGCEMGKSMISKLRITRTEDNEVVANYDRGWEILPRHPQALTLVAFLADTLARRVYYPTSSPGQTPFGGDPKNFRDPGGTGNVGG